ncbi:MAG: S41 family peptidase [Bacteroidota bacterium]|nr:S41 family peptidase [Bacteroidota bacterium]
MKKLLLAKFILALILLSLFSCSKKDEPLIDTPTISSTTLAVNKFINESMTEDYLWTDKMPSVDYTKESDPKAYFKKLLYTTDDHWSFITDDYASLANSFQGVEKSFGYSLAFGQFTGTSNYFAVVEYVNPNTPASTAGIKRGDIFIKIDGSNITESNYMNLFYKESVTLTKGTLTSQGIATGGTVSLTGEELTINPILMKKIINHGGKKIGYMVYNQFIGNYNDSIDKAVQYFKSQQIDDLILDLRYNPGGGVDAARHICSCLAPQSAVNDQKLLVTYKWNTFLQSYFENGLNTATKSGIQDDIDYYTSQLKVNYDKSVAGNLNLSRLYVLTTRGTASASELTITGLRPYMNVTCVGDTTHGKYTASITIQPMVQKSDGSYVVDSNISNWAIQPIVLRYANSNGVTDFKNGFVPDYYVNDELLPAVELGDSTEPLLKKALEQITGVQVIAMKTVSKPILPYRIIDRASSKYEQFHRNLIVPKLKTKTQKILF